MFPGVLAEKEGPWKAGNPINSGMLHVFMPRNVYFPRILEVLGSWWLSRVRHTRKTGLPKPKGKGTWRANLFTVFSVIIAMPSQWPVGQDGSWGEGGPLGSLPQCQHSKLQSTESAGTVSCLDVQVCGGEGRGVAVFWFCFSRFFTEIINERQAPSPQGVSQKVKGLSW